MKHGKHIHGVDAYVSIKGNREFTLEIEGEKLKLELRNQAEGRKVRRYLKNHGDSQ